MNSMSKSIVHFLARNNLPVKELYRKIVKFLSDEINEISSKHQYLEEIITLKHVRKMLPMAPLILVIL